MAPHSCFFILFFLPQMLTAATQADSVKNESAVEEIKIGVLLPEDDKYSWSLPRTQPALEYAVENIEKQMKLLPGYKIQLYFNDSKCSETFGPLAAIEMYVQRLAHVFIGPACDYAVAPIARFTKYWGIPILSAGALVNAFKNKKEYSLLTRVQGSFDKAGEFFLMMCQHFNWTNVGLLYKENKVESKSRCYFALEAIFLHWKNVHNTKLWHKAINETASNFTGHLMEASLKTRIIVLCASPDTVREIMIRAHELNFDNGEYVFFNIDLFRSKAKAERPWYRENDTRNDVAKKAFQALMTVTLRKPDSPAYKMFSQEVKRRAQSNGSNFTYGEEEVNSFVGAFHDAVILYALALNETLEAKGSITNGKEITRRMWNRTFEGITGNVSIDDNGDRNADYSLLDMTDPESGRFEVVANYYGKTKEYEPVADKKIHWPGKLQRPPPDTPKCGFDGSKCPPDSPFPDYGIVISVFGTLLVIVGIAAVFLYRHGKLEAELEAMNWRVKWEDITFGNKKSGKKNLSEVQAGSV